MGRHIKTKNSLQVFCDACDQEIELLDMFCGHCGHPVKTTCDECHRSIDERMTPVRFCVHCGTKRPGFDDMETTNVVSIDAHSASA